MKTYAAATQVGSQQCDNWSQRQRSPAKGAQIARENPNEITGNVGGRGRKNGGEESEAEAFPAFVFWEGSTLRKMKKILTYNDLIPSCFNKEPSLSLEDIPPSASIVAYVSHKWFLNCTIFLSY